MATPVNAVNNPSPGDAQRPGPVGGDVRERNSPIPAQTNPTAVPAAMRDNPGTASKGAPDCRSQPNQTTPPTRTPITAAILVMRSNISFWDPPNISRSGGGSSRVSGRDCSLLGPTTRCNPLLNLGARTNPDSKWVSQCGLFPKPSFEGRAGSDDKRRQDHEISCTATTLASRSGCRTAWRWDEVFRLHEVL